MELFSVPLLASVVPSASEVDNGWLLSLFFKSLVIGIIGATDCVVIVLSNPKPFSHLGFLGMWSFLSAFFHFILKSLAGILSSSIAHSIIDIVAFVVTAWVAWVSVRELEHALHSFEHKKLGEFAIKPIRHNSIETWLLLAAACAIDAYPLGHLKGIVMSNAEVPRLLLGYLVSSAVVGLFTLGVALLARKIEMRWRNPVDDFNVVVRALHAWVFLAMIWGMILQFVMLQLNIPPLGKSLFVPVVVLLGLLPLSARYGRMIRIAWLGHIKCREQKRK